MNTKKQQHCLKIEGIGPSNYIYILYPFIGSNDRSDYRNQQRNSTQALLVYAKSRCNL